MDAKTALQAKGESKQKPTIQQWITSMKPEIEKALPSIITVERFSRMAVTAIRMNPKLSNCTPISFMAALMQAAQLGLEPNTPLGQAFLIPYYNNKNKVFECQFQIGYKGIIELAHRSREFTEIYSEVVYENDEFEYELGLDRKLRHKPTTGERGNPVKFYSVYKLVNGGFGFAVMTYDDVKAHANRYSKSVNNGPWITSFEEMAKKTTLKQVLKYAPIKTEFVRELSQDETIKTELSSDMTDVEGDNVFEAEYEVYEEPQDAQQQQ